MASIIRSGDIRLRLGALGHTCLLPLLHLGHIYCNPALKLKEAGISQSQPALIASDICRSSQTSNCRVIRALRPQEYPISRSIPLSVF